MCCVALAHTVTCLLSLIWEDIFTYFTLEAGLFNIALQKKIVEKAGKFGRKLYQCERIESLEVLYQI